MPIQKLGQAISQGRHGNLCSLRLKQQLSSAFQRTAVESLHPAPAHYFGEPLGAEYLTLRHRLFLNDRLQNAIEYLKSGLSNSGQTNMSGKLENLLRTVITQQMIENQ